MKRRAALAASIAAGLVMASATCPAAGTRDPVARSGVPPRCAAAAALHYGIPPDAIRLLLAQEGGRVGAVHRNEDGSVDYGPMQINSQWVPRIAASRHADPGAVAAALRDDGCYNVWVGAWLLSREVADAGGNLWAAIGLYHSPTPALRLTYLRQVVARARAILRGGTSARNAQAGAR